MRFNIYLGALACVNLISGSCLLDVKINFHHSPVCSAQAIQLIMDAFVLLYTGCDGSEVDSGEKNINEC